MELVSEKVGFGRLSISRGRYGSQSRVYQALSFLHKIVQEHVASLEIPSQSNVSLLGNLILRSPQSKHVNQMNHGGATQEPTASECGERRQDITSIAQ